MNKTIANSGSPIPANGLDNKRVVQSGFDSQILLASRIAFAVTLILIPARLRIDLLTRPFPPVYGDYTDFLLFAPDLSMLLLLGLWGLSLLINTRRVRLGTPIIWLPLAGVTLSGWISVINSEDPSLSLYHGLRLLLLFCFYLYIVNEIRSPGWVIVPVALQVELQALVAIAQFLAQSSIGLQPLGELLLNPDWQGVSIVAAGSQRLLRAYGLSDHPNILGGCLAFGLLVMLATFMYGRERARTFTLVLFLPGLLALLLTYSRSGWLAFLAGSAVLLGTQAAARRWERLIPIGWLALASIVLLAPFIWANLSFFGARLNIAQSIESEPAEQQSIGERALLNNSANSIFVESPLTGIGLGVSPLALRERFPGFPVDYQPPHFTLLAAAVETGIFGAMFYFLLGILPWLALIPLRRRLSAQPVLLTSTVLLLAVTVVGFFDYYTWLLVPGRLWQWLIWGLWAAAIQRVNS